MTLEAVLLWVAGALLTAGAALAVYRVVRGPTILDRMIASDVLLTTLLLALGTLMVAERRSDLVPVLLVLATTAAFATIAVSRSVSKHDRVAPVDAGVDPLLTVPGAASVLQDAVRSTGTVDDATLDADELPPQGRDEP